MSGENSDITLSPATKKRQGFKASVVATAGKHVNKLFKVNRADEDSISSASTLSTKGHTHGIAGTDVLVEPLHCPQTLYIGEYTDSPIFQVKRLLDGNRYYDKGSPEAPEPRPLFCELLSLVEDDDHDGCRLTTYEWMESARWIKYEERVVESGRRWTKPHISLLNIASMLQLKNCISRGVTELSGSYENLVRLVEHLISRWRQQGRLSLDATEDVRRALLSPKRHLIRSHFRDRLEENKASFNADYTNPDERDDSVSQPSGEFVFYERKTAPLTLLRTPSSSSIPSYHRASSFNAALLKKIPMDSEAANVLVGRITTLQESLCAFVRMNEAQHFLDIPEVPLPTRFVFILLGPHHRVEEEIHAVGRCMATLLADKVFSKVAYLASNVHELCNGFDEFIAQSLIIPPGKWNAETQIEPDEDNQEVERHQGQPDHLKSTGSECSLSSRHELGECEGLQRTGRLFGGLMNDLRMKIPRYLSDFKDVFNKSNIIQCFGATIFIFFANLTTVLIFAGVLDNSTHGSMGATEGLLTAGLCGVLYSLFSGQPLCIFAPTGHTLAFELITFKFCKGRHLNFFPFRCWMGIWSTIIMLLLVAFDMSVLVEMITKFTEEIFAALVSVMFIIHSFQQLAELSHRYPITHDWRAVVSDPCLCNVTESVKIHAKWLYFGDSGTNNSETLPTEVVPGGIEWESTIYSNLTYEECHHLHGEATGLVCRFHPDVYLFCVIIFFASFIICISLSQFKKSDYFPTAIRSWLSDFNVILSVIIMTGVCFAVGLDVPFLTIPARFRPTMNRSWLLNPFEIEAWWIAILTVIPGLLFTMLILVDQQVAAVIINRKEQKLKKGYGYHLDLLVLSVNTFICSLFGLPFYVAAPIPSIMHSRHLRLYHERAAPGEKPQFLGVIEQRVTSLIAQLLIGLSVFLNIFVMPVIRLIPLATLLGIYLYMGVSSLSDIELTKRVEILFMPVKYQPDYSFLRLIPLSRVNFYTIIQLVAFSILLAVKFYKLTSILFPAFMILLVVLRWQIGRFFTRTELNILDDPLPRLRNLLTPQHDKDSPHRSCWKKRPRRKNNTGTSIRSEPDDDIEDLPLAPKRSRVQLKSLPDIHIIRPSMPPQPSPDFLKRLEEKVQPVAGSF